MRLRLKGFSRFFCVRLRACERACERACMSVLVLVCVRAVRACSREREPATTVAVTACLLSSIVLTLIT